MTASATHTRSTWGSFGADCSRCVSRYGKSRHAWFLVDQLSDGESLSYWYDAEMGLYHKERDALTEELRHLEEVAGADRERALRESWEAKKRSVLDGLGVLCFTATSANLLLWAHYADAHRGLCLEYDSEVRPVKGWKRYRFFPVGYSQHRPLDILKLVWDHAFFSLITQKSLEWAYEKEHRLISIRGSGYQQGTIGSVTGIILGMRIGERDPAIWGRLFEALRKMDEHRRSVKKLTYYRAEKNPSDFAVRLLPLHGLRDVRIALGL